MTFRIGTYEAIIEAAPRFGFFEFDHIEHGARDRELLVLGRHLVASRL